MFAVIENNNILYFINSGDRLIVNATDYGTTWFNDLSTGQLAALGVKEIVESVHPDQRFYWVQENIELVNGIPQRNYTTTPKDLDMLKSYWVNETKSNTKTHLSFTDWYIIRKFERNIDIPESIVIERNNLVSNCNTKVNAINNCSTVDELFTVMSQ